VYYGGAFNSMMILANVILLIANLAGVVGSLSMNLITILCSLTWVAIMIFVYLFLILLTFMVAEGTGYEVVMLMIPTIIDCIFACAVLPFIWELINWFDKSKKLEKDGIKLGQ